VSDLRSELRAVGIRGAQARRILAETSAHDPAALGDPRRLAQECADALAPRVARRGAYAAFAALAVAAAVAAVSALTIDVKTATQPQSLALALAFLAAQVAFVAGSLATWRALHRPRDVATISKRSLVGILFGAVTIGFLAFASHSWLPLVSLVVLAATVPFIARGLALHTRVVERGDLGDDFPFRVDPRAVAIGAGTIVALAGIAQGDPFDGLIRGVFEGLACFGGYLALGRFIGLRR
jgi:hypothetical protein